MDRGPLTLPVPETPGSPRGGKPSRAGPLTAALLVGAAIILAALVSYEASARAFRAQKERELATFAALKVEAVERWRAERLTDAEAIAADAMLIAALERNAPIEGELREEVEQWFQGLLRIGDYRGIALLGRRGELRWATGVASTGEDHAPLVQEAFRSGGPILSDVGAAGGRLHLDVIVPVFVGGHQLAGAVLFRIDPRAYFFPMLSAGNLASAETLLVRRDGDALRVLNASRDRPDPLVGRLPAAPPFLPARGDEVSVGPDERGVRVLAASRAIPGSPWALVAKVDTAEAFAPLRERLLWTSIATIALVLATAAAAALWWRGRVGAFERQRMLVDAERRALARRLERITRWSHDLVILTDDRHRILEVNDTATLALGYSREELIGKPMAELRDPATVADFGVRVRDEIQHGVAVFETRYRRKDGSTFPVEVTVHVDEVDGRRFFQGITRDLSERRHAEEQLRASEARFRAAFEGAGLGIALLEGEGEGRVLEANPALCEMLGLEEEELKGRPFAELLHPETRADGVAALERVGNGEGRSLEGPQRCVARGGAPVDVVLRASGLRGADEVRYVLAIVEDVSEQKELERRLHLADRMASLGTLAAGVAHEINNPLAYMLSNLDFSLEALRPAAIDPEVLTALEDARAGAVRVRNIVGELRAFTRSDDAQGRRADLARATRAALDLAAHELHARARVVLDLAPVPPVRGSEQRLEQVMVNLLVNAAQATPDGDPAAHAIRVATGTAPDGRAFAEVSDDGCGIDPEVLPRIFDPFFTTKPVGLGTGLGLSVCHAIVAALSGEIQVESAPGHGATFRVLLPAPAVQAAPPDPATLTPAPAQPADAAPDLSAARVLVVDDDALVGRAVLRVLSPPHHVTVAASGKEALAALDDAAPFDLVLCDLMMPGMTGMDLHEQVRARSPRLADRFIFLTGGAHSPAAIDFLARCANLRVEKPFAPAALREAVARAIGAAGQGR